MCLQAAKELGLRGYFESAGFTLVQCDLSLAHIISRAVHPAFEHATVDWLRDNTALCELMGMEVPSVNRYKLYATSRLLYNNRDGIENYLSHKTSELSTFSTKSSCTI